MNLPVKRKTTSGMTLLEILLVVTVMGIIFAAVTANWWVQQGRGLDTKRKADLERIRIAALNYEGDNNCFPDPDDVYCGSTELQPYLDEVPCEPTGDSFLYERPACGKFVAYTTLAWTSDPAIREKGCLVGCGPDFTHNYYVQEGMTMIVDFNAVPSGDIPTMSPILPTCGTAVKYCFANVCSACCPGSHFRCDSTGAWCIPDSACE